MSRIWLLINIWGMLMLLPAGTTAQYKQLGEADFIAIVKTFHPVSRQAAIAVQRADANITLARAGFDPALYLTSEQKTLDGKNYYTHTNPELKIPAWYGIEVKAGLENNGGQYLSTELTEGKTSYIGLSVPVAKNLLMDKRRAALQQAKLLKNQTEAERRLVINNLLFEAYNHYWSWVQAYQVYQIISNAVSVNRQRFELVKIGFRQGDRPAIDTVEALAQLQNFEYLLSESNVQLQNAAVQLSEFLWLPDNTYYQLPADVQPTVLPASLPNLPLLMLEDLLYTARLTHPKLQSFSYKLDILEVERKLKFQSLLPTVNVKAYLLNKGYDNMFNGIGKAAFYENNNKFGIDVGLPLRLSEGRGAYRMAKLKIEETNYELSVQQQAIENKIRMYYNELLGLQQQVASYLSVTANYQALLRGEETRFKAGESSLFLLNSRENKVLEAQQKLTALTAKYFKTLQAVQWAAGQLK
jgi:outer membrane protein TolC